jgi:plasmid stability protein
MSSELHIAELNDDTFRRLEKEAATHGMSPAEWAALVLTKHYHTSVGPHEAPTDKATAISRMFGTWDEEQVREFMQATADFERIDEDMWK